MTPRELPHSLEAEEYLLSCCFIDGTETVARCKAQGVTPRFFFAPANAIIFQRLLSLHERDRPIDTAIVAEELKAGGQLDAIGGFAYLAQVSSRIPTTAQAAYFIERVRDLHILREIIRAAGGIVEDSFSLCDGSVEEFVAEARDRFDRATNGRSAASDDLARRLFDPRAPIPETRIAFRIGSAPVSSAGNLTVIAGQAKAGKSSLVGAFLAASMTRPELRADCLGVSGANKDGKALVLLDTEQSLGDFNRLLHAARRRAKVDEFPPWLRAYNLTGKDAHDARRSVEIAMTNDARLFGGLFAVIVDGVADLVIDPNDAGEVFPFVARLHALAIKHDAPLILVLHQNPGTEKGRGHLGSQLERKAESNLTLEREPDGTVVLYATKQRGAPISKDDGPRFRWSPDEEMHLSVESRRKDAEAAKSEALRALADDVFEARSAMRYGDLLQAIKSAAKCSERTAETRFGELKRAGLIQRHVPNLWCRVA